MAKMLTHLAEITRGRKGIIGSIESHSTWSFIYFALFNSHTTLKEESCYHPHVICKESKRIHNLPRIIQIASDRTGGQTQFSSIAKPIFILRGDSAFLRPRWMATHSITPHLRLTKGLQETWWRPEKLLPVLTPAQGHAYAERGKISLSLLRNTMAVYTGALSVAWL